MASYFSRPQQSISALTYKPWASRTILLNNINQLSNRIGPVAHSHIVESLYRDGIVKRPDLNLTDIKETDIKRFVTKKKLDLYPDLTSLIISESDFEANENLKKLEIPDIGKKIVSHLKESSIIDANGKVDKQKAESLNISENSDLVKKFDNQLSNEQIQILNEGIKQVLNSYNIENPFDYGNKTLNVALNETINALSWIKSAGGNFGWRILKYSDYAAAIFLGAVGLAGICATLLTLPSPIGVGTGLYIAGKTSKIVANKIDPNLSFLGYKVASLLNWTSRVLPILGIIIGGIGFGSELFSSEFSFIDEFKDMEIFMAIGMSYFIGKYFFDVAKNIKELKASYGGQIDPGKLGRMKKEMYAAISSVTFDKIYLGVRFLLLAVSSIFVGSSIGLWPMLGMATFPIAGIAATVYLRNSEWFATEANVLDWINSPVLKRLINIDDSIRAIPLSDISSNIPQIKNFLGKFFDPSSKLKISKGNDAEKFLEIINSAIKNKAIKGKINKTKTITLGDLEEVLKDEVMQYALKKDIDLFKVFEGSSSLFFKKGLDEKQIKDELNKIFNEKEKLIVENQLIQKFRSVNQKIKDQWMVYTPLYGFKSGLYASAFISGGLLLALATATALPISKRFGSFATNLIFEKESDTAVKAIASTAFRLAPIVGMGLLLSSGMGIGLAGLAAYGALMGSIACYASELHGVGHSINSSEGFKVALKASSKDLLGENYIREKIKNVSTLLLNPHTGTFEHTIGIIFTMLFNTVNPNISVICSSDRPPYAKAKGFDKDLSVVHSEKELINFVTDLRKEIFNLLQRHIFDKKELLEDKYLNLAKNLRDVASWYRSELSKQLRERYHTELRDKKRVLKTLIEKILKDKKEENTEKIMVDLFENPEEEILVLKPDWEENCNEELKKQIENTIVNFDSFTEDAFRVAMEQLELTASEFEQKANQLEQKVQKGLISEQDFDNELDILRCFDSDLIEITTVSRKEISGDERMVRKVENVAALPLFRGLTVYKFWKTSSSENYPIVDWVAGTWTRVRNPKFKYGAERGLEAAKYIWIKRDHILTEVQREYEESLSTSDIIAKVDNDPSKDILFKSGSEKISISVNDTEIELKEGDYYYNLDAKNDQKATPKVSKIIGRDKTEFHFNKEKRTLPDGSINIDGDFAKIFKGIKMTGESFINIPDAPIGTISKDGLIVDMKNKGFSEDSINLVVSALDKIFDKVPDINSYFEDDFKNALNETTNKYKDLREYLQTLGQSFINNALSGTISTDWLKDDMKKNGFSENTINLVISNLNKLFDKVPDRDDIYRYKASEDDFKNALEKITTNEELRKYLQTLGQSFINNAPSGTISKNWLINDMKRNKLPKESIDFVLSNLGKVLDTDNYYKASKDDFEKAFNEITRGENLKNYLQTLLEELFVNNAPSGTISKKWLIDDMKKNGFSEKSINLVLMVLDKLSDKDSYYEASLDNFKNAINEVTKDENLKNYIQTLGESFINNAPSGTISKNWLIDDMKKNGFSEESIDFVLRNLDKVSDRDDIYRYKASPDDFKNAIEEITVGNYLQTLSEKRQFINISDAPSGTISKNWLIDDMKKNGFSKNTINLVISNLDKVPSIKRYYKASEDDFKIALREITTNEKLRKYLQTLGESFINNAPSGTISKNWLIDDMKKNGFSENTINLVISNLDKVPSIKRYYKASEDDFKIALREITDKDLRNYLQTIYEMLQISPSVMTFDAFDYQVMMDKNDIEVKTHLLLPSILERERESSKIIDIIYKYKRPNTTYTFEKTEIPDGAQISDIEVVDANIEISYVDNDGNERIIPFKIDRSAIITWRKDGAQDEKDPDKKSISGAEVETDEDGNVIRFSLLYNAGKKKFDLELNAKPRYLKYLFKDGNIPKGKTTTLKLNAFFDDPFREGDMPWLKVTYKENEAANVEQVKFIRCWEQARPMLFKKKGLHKPTKKGNNEFDFGYFSVSIKNGTLIIDNVRLPRGKSIKLVSAWAKKLKEGDKIKEVDNSGDIYIVDGKFTPIKPNNSAKNLKGNIIGIVEGEKSKYNGKVVDLGKYIAHKKLISKLGKKLPSEQIDGIIEITPAANGKLEVVSRRLDAKGLPIDSSAYIYNLTDEATKRLQSVIPDLSWIDQSNIEIENDKVILHYKVPGIEKDQTFELYTNDMFDNFNVAFLKNKKMEVNSVESIYTGKNENFKPTLDLINGNLRLIVHKVDRWQINRPEELRNETGFTITPTKATSAVKINEEWIPLNIDQPIINKDVLEIDYDLSQVFDGQIHSVIGPQSRFGNWGDFSLQYPRDPYFYGLPIAANFETINEYGENFGLNRAKALRAHRGIQSGRTHTMPYTFLHNLMFADIMETNSDYYKKLSNYGHWLTGVGVSEDTQMEMVLWLLGMKMHVVKDMLTIMAAEKTFDRYKIQNVTRYNYSEVLFAEPFKLALWDIMYGISPSIDPFYFASPEAMSELAAGRTWYKYPWAKSVELSAIPTFLLSRGFVPFYPVDMALFMTAWSLRTFFDMWNYKQQMNSIGYGLIETGLFGNPAKEIGFIKGYNDAAWTQWLQRYQYATFALTSSGGAGKVPQEFKDLVNLFFGATAGAEAFALSSLFLTTILENLAANPSLYSSIQNAFGIGLGPGINIAFGLLMTAVLQKARKNLIVEALPPKPQVTLKRAFKITAEDLSKIIVPKNEKIKDTIRENTGFKFGTASAKENLNRAKKVIERLINGGILSVSVKNFKDESETYSLMIYDTNNIKTKVENALKNALSEREINSVVNFLTDLAKQQNEKYDKYYEELNKITSKIKDNSSYSDLFDARDKLFNILRGLDCVDKKGRISFGMQNKWRDQANEILEIMALIEMRICINAINDIKNNKLPSQAISALRRVMATTQEYLIIEAAAKMYRLVTTGKDKPKVEPNPIPKNEITNEGAKK